MSKSFNEWSDEHHQGIGFSSAMFLLFLGLKLANIGEVAHWSWWWVFAPLWVGAILKVFIYELDMRKQ